MKILTEHIEKVCSLEPNLFFISTCSVRNLNILEVTTKTSFCENRKILNPGEVIDVILCKGERGFGFTIVGGDDPGEMIQINAIVATGNDNRTGKHQW